MRIKFILPSLTEAESPFFRPIKYSLFPPLGLATLAGFLDADDEPEIVDQHVEALHLDDAPDVVGIEVYITNAYRAYAIADQYRARGVFVILGGLHVTSLPDEAAAHADTIFIGPAEESFPRFLEDFRRGEPHKRYVSTTRTIAGCLTVRRDLIKRSLYLVPNSIVVSRGCPHHCDFCYKDAFFAGGRSFYTQRVDEVLREIARLPGRHLYFLDDHLLGHRRFARTLFDGMTGMRRIFQGASTVSAILDGDLIEHAARAGLRSVFIGFETLNTQSLVRAGKVQNINRDYAAAISRLHDLGIMINGSFVFGLDGDGPDVFERTVDWAIGAGISTATFHIATPYPGTAFMERMRREGRVLTDNWDLYDTRHVTFQPVGMSIDQLQTGYHQAYRDFYTWTAIARSSAVHETTWHKLRHFLYAAGWKKFEPLWALIVQLKSLGAMTPVLERLLKTDESESAGGPVDCSTNELLPRQELTQIAGHAPNLETTISNATANRDPAPFKY